MGPRSTLILSRHPARLTVRGTRPTGRFRRAFTLIEAAFVTVIIGFVVVAFMQLLAAGTVANAESNHLTTSVNLAGNIHAATLSQPIDTILSLHGKTYSPPVDSRLQPLAHLGPRWSQTVRTAYVDPGNISAPYTGSAPTPLVRITCVIRLGDEITHTSSWIIAK